MPLLRNENIVNILENTLNCVDTRVIGHGKRLAYMAFRTLGGRYASAKLRDICLLAMLHDVGAYKTEDIDNMYYFETRKVWEHSIYGYLFLKHFSPLSNLAEAVLFHHAPCGVTSALCDEPQLLAQLINLGNVADMFAMLGRSDDELRRHIEPGRDKVYSGEVIDMFHSAVPQIGMVSEGMDSNAGFNELLYNTPMSKAEANGYIKMIISSIDFRSSQTVIHTRAVSCVAEVLAYIMKTAKQNISEHDIEKIRTAALLHDIGKVSTPLYILEGTSNRLTDEEMEIMRKHVVVSEEILEGNVPDDVKDIAVNHHEKPDGSGYPKKLTVLTAAERPMAVADVFSALCGARSYKEVYPKEKIIGILKNMAARNHLDAEIVDLAVVHYDKIITAANIETDKAMADYNIIGGEYDKMLEKFTNSEHLWITD